MYKQPNRPPLKIKREASTKPINNRLWLHGPSPELSHATSPKFYIAPLIYFERPTDFTLSFRRILRFSRGGREDDWCRS